LKIVVIGGSHTSAGCLKNEFKHCFGNIVADYLNEKFPVEGCSHTSTGSMFGWHGSPSTTHAYKTRHQIRESTPADIVLLEFANNDLEYEATDSTNMFRRGWQLEYIYRKWREAGLAVMFVETSFRIKWDSRRAKFHATNAEEMHLEFQRAFHVPTVSFSKGVLPEFWENRFDPLSKYYESTIFADYRTHMVPRGQAIVAAMIMKTFENILQEIPEPFQVPEEFQFIPELYYKRMEEDTIFQVNFNDQFVLGTDVDNVFSDTISGKGMVNFTKHWNITDEGRKNKWGLLSTTPGSYVTIQIPRDSHVVYLTLLKSYEKMGSVKLMFENCTTGHQFSDQIIDCLWEPKASQNYIFSTEFESNACSRLKIAVQETTRLANKVKLISISFT
jgi:hypothetical protein